jgi:hypothetical protein
MKWDWPNVFIVVVLGFAIGEIVRLLGKAVAELQQIRDILLSVTGGPRTPSEDVDEYRRTHP